MVNFQNKKIFYTLKEYQNNYNILLNNYLKQHEDFDELSFLEIELQFYNLCYDNSNLIRFDLGYGPQYSVNGGHCELLILEIYEAISLNDGFNFELSTKYNASFYKILLFLIDKKKKADIISGNLFSVENNDLLISDKFNENLQNDPLLSLENEYQSLKSKFKEDHSLKTAHLKNEDDLFLHDLDDDFKDWENTQNEEIKNSFLKLIKQLNQNKIFFFGCSFDNYKHNYSKRLNKFLEHYVDASKSDFIDDELQFLENILYDIQNSEGAHDGYSVSGYSNFIKAYEFVSLTGYKQYFFSHNKKEDFLNKKQSELTQEEKLIESVTIDNHKVTVEQEKTKMLEVFEGEQKKIEVQNEDDDKDNQNNILKSTIEEYLETISEKIKPIEYNLLVDALYKYFKNNDAPILEKKINLGRLNKKKVGWVLKEIYWSVKKDKLSYEYLYFAKQNISIFENVELNKDDFFYCNLYKYFTTKS